MPVYHPNFFSQCLRLLRATCIYCHHFRLSRVEVHRYSCKLRLLQYGLAKEAERIDDLDVGNINNSLNADEDDKDVTDANEDEVIDRRNVFLRNAIKSEVNYRSAEKQFYLRNESLSERRILVIKGLLLDLAKAKKCARCDG